MNKLVTTARRFRAGFTLVELLTVIAIIGILAAMLLPVLAAATKAAKKKQAAMDIASIVTAIEAYDQAYGRFPVSTAAQNQASQNAKNGLDPDFTYGGTFGLTIIQTPGLFLTNSEVIAILMDYTNYPGASTPPPTTFVNLNHQKNPQQTKFLTPKMSTWATGSPNPPLPGVGTDLVFRDPWGNPYIISLDLNYDDACNDAFYSLDLVSQQTGNIGWNGLVQPKGTTDNFQFHGKVMVWSAGPDGKIDPAKPANAGVNKDNILSWQ